MSLRVKAASCAAWRLGVGLLAFGAGASAAWLRRTRVGVHGRLAPITLPAEVKQAVLLEELRSHFVRLQAAWDAREVGALRALATPQMLAQLCDDWPGCSAAANRTDVVTLHAELLGFEAMGEGYLVTIEFSGLIRESAQQGAAPFRELWMLARSKHDGLGWKLARQQALL